MTDDLGHPKITSEASENDILLEASRLGMHFQL